MLNVLLSTESSTFRVVVLAYIPIAYNIYIYVYIWNRSLPPRCENWNTAFTRWIQNSINFYFYYPLWYLHKVSHWKSVLLCGWQEILLVRRCLFRSGFPRNFQVENALSLVFVFLRRYFSWLLFEYYVGRCECYEYFRKIFWIVSGIWVIQSIRRNKNFGIVMPIVWSHNTTKDFKIYFFKYYKRISFLNKYKPKFYQDNS